MPRFQVFDIDVNPVCVWQGEATNEREAISLATHRLRDGIVDVAVIEILSCSYCGQLGDPDGVSTHAVEVDVGGQGEAIECTDCYQQHKGL